MKTFLKMIKTVWFWSGLILLISTIALFITLFGSKVFINNTYDGLCKHEVCVGGGEDFGIELHKNSYATVYRGNSRPSIPCTYSIQGNTLILRSTPNWDRAYGSYEKTFIIKNRFTLLCEEQGHKWKADNISLIYIGEVMGISAFVFLHSGISTIKKHNKKKKATQSE